jgi:hypothetical protein
MSLNILLCRLFVVVATFKAAVRPILIELYRLSLKKLLCPSSAIPKLDQPTHAVYEFLEVHRG